MLDVRHPVEPGDVENQHREDHLRVAPALRRAAAHAWETDQEALRRQHFKQQHQPVKRKAAEAPERQAVQQRLLQTGVRQIVKHLQIERL